MKNGKYSVSSFAKLKGKRRMVAALALALILVCTVGGTLAYVFMDTDPVENKFTPSKVTTAVVENGKEYTNNDVSVTEKRDVKIKNTGDTAAYIRAAIVVTWKKADGTVYAMKPQVGTDYNITIGSNWTEKDGYYYYAVPVPAVDDASTTDVDETLTDALITSCTPAGNNAPDGYKLSVEIVASGIQSTGMGATSVQDAWAKAQGNN